VDRSPEDMLATFHWFHGEGFDLIVADLLALAPEPVAIARSCHRAAGRRSLAMRYLATAA